MNKWLQKNNKQILAIVMVFLMVAFLLPSTFQGCSGRGMHVGTVNGKKLTEIELRNSYGEWEYVLNRVFIAPRAGDVENMRPLLSAFAIGSAAREIDQNKSMYMLLKEEAQQMGASISPATLDAILAQVLVRHDDGRIMDYESIREKNEGKVLRNAVANVLSVEAAFLRAAANVKVSAPQRQLELAAQSQTVTLGIVPFDANSYADKITAPTTEQLQEQFNKYADVLASENGTKENPFGFGYRFPDRLKVQYLMLPRSEIRKAVLAQKSEYDWEVDARKHYLANLASFPSTQPASTQPGAATQPAHMPFEQAKDRALDAVLAPKMESLARMVQQRIILALNNDYTAYAKSQFAAASAPAPGTALGPAFDTFDYLTALSTDVQKQFGVVLTAANLGDQYRSAKDLANMPTISDAEAMVQGRPEPFATYAFQAAEPLMPAESKDREQAFALHVFQPSQAMTTFDGTFAIFRITAAQPAHKPATIDEVAAQVESDVKRRLQYEAAAADAKKLLESAANTNLNSAASSAGKLVIDSGPMRLMGQVAIPGLLLGNTAQQQFRQQAFDLLTDLHPVKPPTKLIELPTEAKALAVELRALEGSFPAELTPMLEANIASSVQNQTVQLLAPLWFNYDSVVERTGYVDPYAKPKSAETAAAN